MNVRLHPDARLEMREAARYYRQFGDKLPQRIRAEIESAIKRVAENPKRYPILEGQWRKVRLHKFPYGLIHREFAEEIQVVAFAHHKREPGYWRKRPPDLNR